MTDTAGDPSRVRIVPVGGKVTPSYAIFYFYVRRADFDLLYPTGKPIAKVTPRSRRADEMLE